MNNARAAKRPVPKRAGSAAKREACDGLERDRIAKSMGKWLQMDATAKLLGRGLGRRAIIERVALDVGASVRVVRSVIGATEL